MTKYQMMNNPEGMIIIKLGIKPKCLRVKKLSMNPAVINKGTKPIIIFKPCLAPFLKDSKRVKVFGKIRLLPITKPAQPAMTIDEISKVP